MNVPFYIARRYLFSKKSKNAIHYITIVSVLLVAVVSLALIVAMSVFNGLTALVLSLFNSFDPEIKITARMGNTLYADTVIAKANSIDGIAYCTAVAEEQVLFVYADKQMVGKLKGVDTNYVRTSEIEKSVVAGEFVLWQDDIEYISIGEGIAHELAVGLQFRDVMHIYAPNKQSSFSINPMDELAKEYAYARSVFSIQLDIDNSYVISSLGLVQRLFSYKKNEATAIEIACKEGSNSKKIAKQLQSVLGHDFVVQDREKQHEFLYKVTQSEKLITFIIIALILIIASFSIVGALTMLIIEKKQDIFILSSMGATKQLLQSIFVIEGWLISIVGVGVGVIIGVGAVLLQEKFGILKLSGGGFIVDAYPVLLKLPDVLSVIILVLLVGFFMAFIPARIIFKKHIRV